MTWYLAFRYRKTWKSATVRSLALPAVYLLAFGFGLGAVVSPPAGSASLASYVSPGLVALAAAYTAINEATFPVLIAINAGGAYRTMAATELGVKQVYVGHLIWNAVRVSSTSLIFIAMVVLLGVYPLERALDVLVGAALVGLALAAPVAAFAATQIHNGFLEALNRVLFLPMFLFSGVFAPVTDTPGPVRWFAYAGPLWHGVEICRFGFRGDHVWSAIGHALYLAAVATVGVVWGTHTYRRRLAT